MYICVYVSTYIYIYLYFVHFIHIWSMQGAARACKAPCMQRLESLNAFGTCAFKVLYKQCCLMLLAHVLSKCSTMLSFARCRNILYCAVACSTILYKRCLLLQARTLRRCRLLQRATISCAVACSAMQATARGRRQCRALSQCRHGFEPVFDMHAQTLLRSRICMNVPWNMQIFVLHGKRACTYRSRI